MNKLKPQICPECGSKYIRFDLHWINCPKNPKQVADNLYIKAFGRKPQ